MLPVRSHATSAGREKLDPGMPDPGAPPRPPPAAAAGACGRSRANRDGFWFSAEDERDAAVSIELQYLTSGDIDRPDVVLRIDAQSHGGVEAIDVLSEFADELASRIELKESRPTVRKRAVVAERCDRMACSRVHENLALRVRGDAADFAEVRIGWHLQQVGVGIERDVRNRRLSDERS